MKAHPEVLYNEDQVKFLREREAFWRRDNREKFSLLLTHLGRCRRLVDIGCGWGQFLQLAQGRVSEVWGVDESPHSLQDVASTCPKVQIVVCRADRLDLPDDYFDVVVTSQMLHEVKLFGAESETQAVLGEIKRILTSGGRYLLLDHLDAGEGQVTVKLPPARLKQLDEFERKLQCYRATHRDMGDGIVRIQKRPLQDFLTKYWSLNSPMESIEMKETHNVFEKTETTRLMESGGLSVRRWIPFSDIRKDLKRAGGDLLQGEPWHRKFLLVATKS